MKRNHGDMPVWNFIFKEAFFMPFNRKPQKFNAAIKSVVIGSGDKTVTLGGENVLPFYAFDGEIKNGPKDGVEITDLGMEGEPESVKAYYEGAATMGEIAKKLGFSSQQHFSRQFRTVTGMTPSEYVRSLR